jgi:hypothetical protein
LAYALLPGIIGFLSQIHIADFKPFILAETYLLFVINFLGVAAIVSQLPLLLLSIDRFRPLSMPTLLLWQKWVALGAVAACFILPTAPEPLSQLILALFVIAAYELSLGVVWLSRNRSRLLAMVRRLRPAPRAKAPRPVAVPQPVLQPVRPVAKPAPRPVPQPRPVTKPVPKPAPAATRRPVRPMDRPSGPAVIDMRPKH